MKTSTQLKALIRNLSKEKSVQAEIILRNFMLERLLERISLSEYRDIFIYFKRWYVDCCNGWN